MSVGGLILASGAETRRGEADDDVVKQLADFRERPMLQGVLDAHCAVYELQRVLVVLGADAEQIARTLKLGRAQAAVCLDWDSGLSASLRLGMHELSDMDTVIVTLAQEPRIGADLIRRFANEPAGTRACYHGRPGHPFVLGDGHRVALDQLRGDVSADALLQNARMIECGSATEADADTAA